MKDCEDQIVAEKEREEKEKERDRETEREREFTLGQLRLSQGSERRNSASSSDSVTPKLPLQAIMHRFDSDITQLLNLFERQVSRSDIKAGDFVTHLLALLPVEIAELILREPADKIDDFEHVKSILLARYRLSHEDYRQKFTKHQRTQGSP